ncbi:NADPH-dependent FMN reductase [Kutzneria albida DSM 43870]|uniref:NADPH-dependent FMN reductase n=2 Tax=Kutzneria TaxID=43356 RepID=W5W3D2_9PSEU|nr:NADPH-dependent FMN reductase [Kutzneria albida DSM 43870]
MLFSMTAQDKQLKLAVIIGSTRPGRRAPVVAGWFAERVREHAGFELDLVDLAEHAPDDPDIGARLEAADAFVVLTPEYNHSYPAPLKAAIDGHYTQWRAKPIGFVSYGGISGGLRAVEHLRQVFAEMHAATVRDTVSFHNVWEQFDEQGDPRHAEGCATAAKTVLDQLLWWAEALSAARAARPYQA